METAAVLIAINLVLLIAIGLIRQENPFEIWVLSLLAVANALALLLLGIVLSDNSLGALAALAANLVPFVFAVSAVVLLLLPMSVKPRKRQTRS